MVVALQCGAKLMPPDTTLKERDKKRRPVCLPIRRMKQEKKYKLSHANENPFDSCPPEESSAKWRENMAAGHELVIFFGRIYSHT